MPYLSINDVNRLVKQKLYKLETGAKSGDHLVYDRHSKKYVGHIENGNFYQHNNYRPSKTITNALDNLNENDWFNSSNIGYGNYEKKIKRSSSNVKGSSLNKFWKITLSILIFFIATGITSFLGPFALVVGGICTYFFWKKF